MSVPAVLPLFLLLVAYAAAGDPDAIVDAAHKKSASLRLQLLSDWTLSDEGGWIRPTQGYFSTFAAAPIQHIVAAMYKNDNATAVRLAQAALAQANESSHFGSVYEWTVAARAFALFNSRSNCSRCAKMPLEVESRMQNMTFNFALKYNNAGAFCGRVAPSDGGSSMCQSGSENLDFDAKGSGYVVLMELAKDPAWASRPLGPPPAPPPPPGPPPPLPRCQHCCKAGCGLKCCSPAPPAKQACCCVVRQGPVCPPGPPPSPPIKTMTVAEAAAEWDLFFYNKLADLALSGIYSELGSPNYWYRTYPAIFNLADLGSPRVRQRAKMFLDLAMVDSEQLSIAGYRAGAKMRAKKDGGDYPVSDSTDDPIVAYHSGMGRCAGDALKPVLCGEGGPPVWRYADGTGSPASPVWWPHFASRVIEVETSSYQMSPVTILLRHNASVVAAQEYSVTNRLLGEANHTDGSLSRNSSIVHNFYHSPSYGLGTIFFDPAKDTSYGAPPQESMVGITFNNEWHSTVGVPHAAGSKWAAQVGGAAVLAKCGGALGCHYNGDFSTEVYNVSMISHAGKHDPWTIVAPANDLQAWAAAKYVWGGLNETASSITQGVNGSGNHSFKLVPNDPSSPLILFAGDASTFGTMENFTSQVLAASLTTTSNSDGTKVVKFSPPGKLPEIVFPWSESKTTLKMPSIGGVPVSATPRDTYNGPFMKSTLGERTVTTSSGPGGLTLLYNFATDTITKV